MASFSITGMGGDPFSLLQRIIEALNEELGEDSIQLIREYTGLDVV